jgi:hypothetical protein
MTPRSYAFQDNMLLFVGIEHMVTLPKKDLENKPGRMNA